jgi:nitroreductase
MPPSTPTSAAPANPHPGPPTSDGPPADRGDYEQLLALVRRRRSVRAIDPHRDVPDEVVQQVLEVARWAPSAGNGQPWEFVVVRDAEMRRGIADLYAKQLVDKREMQEVVWGQRKNVGFTGFRNAPVFVLVLGDPRVIDAYPVRTALEKGESHLVSSLAQATVFAHLAVAALGLGSMWVSDVSSPYMSTMLRSWLDIPRHLRIYDMFGIGYPAAVPPATPRRALAEIVHREHYEPEKARDAAAVERFLFGDTLLGGWASVKEQNRQERSARRGSAGPPGSRTG